MSKTEKESSSLDDIALKYETQEPRIYEVGYLVIPSIGEEELPQAVTTIKEVILAKEAQVISEEYPKLIPLAYTMVKVLDNKHTRFDTAYFGWVKFEAMPHHIPEIQKTLDGNNQLLRYLCILTVRENTMVTGRIQTRSTRASADESVMVAPIDTPVAESVAPMNEEVIDESIENLIID